MNDEAIIEEGIVSSASNGIAEISLIENSSCEECSARIICKPKNYDRKIIEVVDPFGVSPGDTVKIYIKGSTLLRISFILYGIPLILLILGIAIVTIVLNNHPSVDFFSFLTGVGLAGFYYLFLFLNKPAKILVITPRIISFSRKH